MLAVLIPILIVFSALALFARPWIAGLFANEGIAGDPGVFDLAVLMARVAFPISRSMSLATVFAAILNSLPASPPPPPRRSCSTPAWSSP